MRHRISTLFLHDCASVCETLAQQAVKAGDQATIVLPPKGLTTYEELRDRAIIYRAGRVNAAEAYFGALLNGDFDVVVANSRLAWVMGGMAKRLRRTKLVTILHGTDIRMLDAVFPIKRGILERGLKESDFIYYTSCDTRPMVERAGVPFALLPTPIDRVLFAPDGEAESLKGNPRVFVPTRLQAAKGSEVILRVVHHILDSYKDAKLYVVRWPRTEDALQSLAASAPSGRVILMDLIARPSLPKFMRGSSVVIGAMGLGFGSMNEMESLSCGVPAVFYDAYDGYGIPEKSDGAIIDFFDQVVGNEDFRRRKIAQGLRLIEEKHDARVVYESFKRQVSELKN